MNELITTIICLYLNRVGCSKELVFTSNKNFLIPKYD